MTHASLVRRVRLLTALSACSLAALSALLLGGARSERTAQFDEIDVERINVRKPDGNLSLVVSNEARMPGVIYGGEELTEPKGTSGLIFYDGDGSEMGGLTFGSRRDGDRVDHSAHLAFDGRDNDQMVTLGYQETWDGDTRTSHAGGLRFVDRDPASAGAERTQMMRQLHSGTDAERAEANAWLADHGQYGVDWSNRVVVGSIEGRAYIALNDGAARERIRLTVDADGAPHVEMLDADGAVTRDLSAE